jgi:lipoprotein-releasing system permease protein
MFLILTLIVLVAALNIVSGLIMLVKDKSADIAILRTMGAARGSVLRIFLITGASIGVVGTLAGTLLGILVARNVQSISSFISWITGSNVWDPTVRFLAEIPSVIDWREVIMVVLMALVLSFFATLYPAWKAAKTDPVDALRYGA